MAALSSQAKAFFAQGGAAAPVSIDELVLEFQTDKPSIAAAMKTYLSFLMASDLTASDTDVVAGAGGSAAQARPATAVASATYMTMARKVLAAVNAATVPDTPPSGFEAHAPHEYEVAARLVKKVKEGSGKITSLFGRRYFTALQNWDFIEKLARAQLASTDPEVLDAFLRGWRSTLLAEGAEGADESMRRLVWSSDLKKTLAQRQEERKQEVAARNARTESSQNDLEDVKAMLATGDGGPDQTRTTGPTITELTGDESYDHALHAGDMHATVSTMDEIEPVPLRSAGARSASTSTSGGSARNGVGGSGGGGGGQKLGSGSGSGAVVPLGAVLQDAAADGEAPVVEHYRMIDGVKTRIG
uniref:Uncharacterized protein n=1 Tax=Florenciella parvula TaxID=236787 RepID=A0A7S2AWL5_9STRA